MKLFESIALEEVEITEEIRMSNSDDSSESLDVIYEDCVDMDDHFQAVEDIYNVESALGDNPGPEAQAIALIATESIQRRLSIPISNVSLESEEDKDEEKKESFFSRVWKAIKNFFAKIWNWITGLFKKKANSVDNLKKTQEHDAKAVKDLIEEVGSHNDQETRDKIMQFLNEKAESENSALRHFDFMNKSIRSQDIETMLSDLARDIKTISYITNSVEKSAKIISDTFKSVDFNTETDAHTNLEDFQQIYVNLENHFNESTINHDILAIKTDERTTSDVAAYLNKYPIEGQLISSLRVLSSFTRDHHIVFLKKEITENTSLYISNPSVNLFRDKSDKPKSSFDKSLTDGHTLSNIQSWINKSSAVIHELGIYISHLEIVVKKMEQYEETVKKAVDDIEKSEGFNLFDAGKKAEFTKFLKSFYDFIVSHTLTIHYCTSYAGYTLQDILDLSTVIMRAHKEAAIKPAGR